MASIPIIPQTQPNPDGFIPDILVSVDLVFDHYPEVEVVFGCTDDTACNYDSEAGIDNNSCLYPNDGCTCDDPNDAVADNCGICDEDPENDCIQDCSGNYCNTGDSGCLHGTGIFECSGGWGCSSEYEGQADDSDQLSCESSTVQGDWLQFEDLNDNEAWDEGEVYFDDLYDSQYECVFYDGMWVQIGTDCLGECDGGLVEDCLGECDGDAMEDDCGECNGDNACHDCAGVPDGDAEIIQECYPATEDAPNGFGVCDVYDSCTCPGDPNNITDGCCLPDDDLTSYFHIMPNGTVLYKNNW